MKTYKQILASGIWRLASGVWHLASGIVVSRVRFLMPEISNFIFFFGLLFLN
jgi:hypothetical protein